MHLFVVSSWYKWKLYSTNVEVLTMAYEDRTKHYIETLIDNKDWTGAHNALMAYIREYGKDYWATNTLALVESHM